MHNNYIIIIIINHFNLKLIVIIFTDVVVDVVVATITNESLTSN